MMTILCKEVYHRCGSLARGNNNSTKSITRLITKIIPFSANVISFFLFWDSNHWPPTPKPMLYQMNYAVWFPSLNTLKFLTFGKVQFWLIRWNFFSVFWRILNFFFLGSSSNSLHVSTLVHIQSFVSSSGINAQCFLEYLFYTIAN